MSWTYEGNIQSSDLDWVRFTIGDTQVDNQLVSNEEIQGMLSIKEGNKSKAAIACMEYILVRLAQQVDYKIGSTSVSDSTKYQNYLKYYENTSRDLKNGNLSPQAPMTGTPIFTIGMMDGGGDDASNLKEEM